MIGSWKTYLFGTKQASGQRIQTFQIVFRYQFLLYILIKQLLSFAAVKFETYNSFLLGDTVVFIPLGRCAQKVGFPRSSHKKFNCFHQKANNDGSLSIMLAVCVPVIYSETKTADQIQVARIV